MSEKKRTREDDTLKEQSKHQKTDEIPIQNKINKELVKNDINKKEYDSEDCYSNGDPINRCIECGVDMGESNYRQYCGKTFCYNW